MDYISTGRAGGPAARLVTSPFDEEMSEDESLWHATNADITALQRIISSHFRADS